MTGMSNQVIWIQSDKGKQYLGFERDACISFHLQCSSLMWHLVTDCLHEENGTLEVKQGWLPFYCYNMVSIAFWNVAGACSKQNDNCTICINLSWLVETVYNLRHPFLSICKYPICWLLLKGYGHPRGDRCIYLFLKRVQMHIGTAFHIW